MEAAGNAGVAALRRRRAGRSSGRGCTDLRRMSATGAGVCAVVAAFRLSMRGVAHADGVSGNVKPSRPQWHTRQRAPRAAVTPRSAGAARSE